MKSYSKVNLRQILSVEQCFHPLSFYRKSKQKQTKKKNKKIRRPL